MTQKLLSNDFSVSDLLETIEPERIPDESITESGYEQLDEQLDEPIRLTLLKISELRRVLEYPE